MSKLKILYVATRFPYPLSGGRERMIYQSIKFLQNEYDIFFLYFSRKLIPPEIIGKVGVEKMASLSFPSPWEMIKNFFFRFSHSLQENLFYSKRSRKRIENAVESFTPDLIIADMIRTGQFVEDFPIKKILDLDDMLSCRYEQLRKHEYGNLLGTFHYLMPEWIGRVLDSCLLRPLLLRFESSRMQTREIASAKKFDALILTSQKEKSFLSLTLNHRHIESVSQGLVIEPLSKKFTDSNDILFLGNLRTPQNFNSLQFILVNVLPLLDKKNISYRFHIVGEFSDKVRELLFNRDKIELHGFQKDLNDWSAKIRILVAPIVCGTGIKTKILEAMVLGIPVITNSIGAEGIPVEDGKHLIIRNTAEETANEIEMLLKDREFCLLLRKNAYAFVKEKYDFDTIKQKYLKVVKDTIGFESSHLNSDQNCLNVSEIEPMFDC